MLSFFSSFHTILLFLVPSQSTCSCLCFFPLSLKAYRLCSNVPLKCSLLICHKDGLTLRCEVVLCIAVWGHSGNTLDSPSVFTVCFCFKGRHSWACFGPQHTPPQRCSRYHKVDLCIPKGLFSKRRHLKPPPLLSAFPQPAVYSTNQSCFKLDYFTDIGQ